MCQITSERLEIVHLPSRRLGSGWQVAASGLTKRAPDGLYRCGSTSTSETAPDACCLSQGNEKPERDAVDDRRGREGERIPRDRITQPLT